MKQHNHDLRTREIKIEGGATGATGSFEFELDFPKRFDLIVGMAIFPRVAAPNVSDVKVKIASESQDYFNFTTKELFESNNNVSPNNKFFDLKIPCGDELVTLFNVFLSETIAAGDELIFDVVFKVINSDTYKIVKEPIETFR